MSGSDAMHALGSWLQTTSASMYINDHMWVWPACETLHFIGLILLIGNVGIFDLRILGLIRDLPARALNEFVPWGIAGFMVNLMTGIVFFVGKPDQYIDNPA